MMHRARVKSRSKSPKSSIAKSSTPSVGGMQRSKSGEKLSLVRKGPERPRSALFFTDEGSENRKEGFLRKRNRHGRWQKRYFATGATSYLTYSKRRRDQVGKGHTLPSHSKLEKKVLGSVNLLDVDTVCMVLRFGRPSRKFAVRVSTADGRAQESLILRAKSVADASEWVDVLNARRDHFLRQYSSPSRARVHPSAAPDSSAFKSSSFKTVTTDPAKVADVGTIDDKAVSMSQQPRFHSRCPSSEYFEAEEECLSFDIRVDNDGDSVSDGEWWSVHDEDSAGGEDSDDEEEDEDDSATEKGMAKLKAQVSIGPEACSADSVACSPQTAFESPLVAHIPAFEPRSSWREPCVSELRVRGPTYLKDRIKVKSSPPLFSLGHLDVARNVSKGGGRADHIASHPLNRVAIANREATTPLPFLFIVYFTPNNDSAFDIAEALSEVPTTHSGVADVVASTPSLPGSPQMMSEPLRLLARQFFLGDDDSIRDQRFKLIPRIVEGPWIVRSAVGSKPALIGTKLKQRYFRRSSIGEDGKLQNGHPYLEVDIDIASSAIANRITGLALGYCEVLELDCAIVMEGRLPGELPEQTLAYQFHTMISSHCLPACLGRSTMSVGMNPQCLQARHLPGNPS